jgi:hypothetical protein
VVGDIERKQAARAFKSLSAKASLARPMSSLAARETPGADWGPWSGALLFSLLLHALALLLLQSLKVVVPEISSPAILPVTIRQPPPAAPQPIAKVARLPPAPEAAPEPEPPPAPEPPEREIPLPEQQVVSPPEGGVERRPEKTRLLSDTDVSVEEQQVRRGAPAPGPEADGALPREKEASNDSAAKKAPAEAMAERPALPDLKRLLPDAVQLAREGYGQPVEAAPEEETRPEPRGRVRSGGGWRASAEPLGTLDFLPDVREGDITLLNTKADLFAPFVRRVAVRVFQNLLIALRRDLSRTGPSTREQVAAEAVMDERGDMVAVDITERSPGVSLGIDRKLRQACSDGFFDRNPPPEARASDGRIHFVLRTEVASISDQSGYRVGYRVIFQAGLL